jgi:hypothetical protein
MAIVNGRLVSVDGLSNAKRPSVDVREISHNGQLRRQYFKHARDLIQPYLPTGAVNPDFIKYRPADAKRYGMIEERDDKIKTGRPANSRCRGI